MTMSRLALVAAIAVAASPAHATEDADDGAIIVTAPSAADEAQVRADATPGGACNAGA